MNSQNTVSPSLDFAKYPDKLMPTIAQDRDTGEILMVGFANPEALDETRRTGFATFWSRSRNELWTKGLTSGDTLEVEQIYTDCDNDTLIYLVKMNGKGACHIDGWRTCFRKRIDTITGLINTNPSDLPNWSRVLRDEEQMIIGKQNGDPINSSTAKALQGKVSRISQKIAEEGVEVGLAFMSLLESDRLADNVGKITKTIRSTQNIIPDKLELELTDPFVIERQTNRELLIGEVSDLMYRLQILLVRAGIPWSEIETEIVSRRK